jgi:hypothetical protein
MTELTIGVTGGSSLFELGTSNQVEAFFGLIRKHCADRDPSGRWDVLTDRLYARYLRPEELETALSLLERVEKVFGELPVSALDETVASGSYQGSTRSQTLRDEFSKYFSSFRFCAESSVLFHETFQGSAGYRPQPVRLVVATLPWVVLFRDRELSDLDTYNGPPYWLRARVISESY